VLVSLLIQARKRVSNGHRGRLDIIADILVASYGGVKKTYLMYQCNLSFRQLKYYLHFMLQKGLLQVLLQAVILTLACLRLPIRVGNF